MAKRRMLIMGVDDITRLFKDYVGLVGFPADAEPTRFRIDPTTHKISLEVSSNEWTHNQSPEEVKFEVKRTFRVN